MSAPDLDAWLPDPAIRSHHRRTAAADPAALWHAAESLRLSDTRTLGRLVRWRIPGVAADTRFRDLFGAPPFIVLDEGDGWSVSGLVGRIWTLERDYPRLSGPEAFAAWDEPGTARVVFANWVTATRRGRAAQRGARGGHRPGGAAAAAGAVGDAWAASSA